MRRILPFLLASSLALSLIGCQPPGAVTDPGAGTAQIEVTLSGARHVLVTPSYRSTRFEAEVTGAGITGWKALVPDAGTNANFNGDLSNGKRVAYLNAVVPAGDRRIIRVRVYDAAPEPDLLIEELWGVANMPPGVTTPVTIRGATTPVGRIYEKLIATDPAKALTLPIDNVQYFVDKLLNTDSRSGTALDSSVPQISYALLNTDAAAEAIVRGNGLHPFQVPNPIPPSILVPDPANPLKLTLADAMRKKAAVTLQAVDMQGRTLARPILLLVSDPASKQTLASATSPASVTFDTVGPGTWMVEATDMERGGKSAKVIPVPEAITSRAYVVVLPTTERLAGNPDPGANKGLTYADENVPAKLANLGDPGEMAIHAGTLYYLDRAGARIRAIDLRAATPTVKTIAGVGRKGYRGDGGPAKEAELALKDDSGLAIDRDGNLYVSQDNNVVRRIDATGAITEFYRPGDAEIGYLGYSADAHTLYVGERQSGGLLDHRVTGLNLSSYVPPGAPAPTPSPGATPPPPPLSRYTAKYGGYWNERRQLAVAGDGVVTVGREWLQPLEMQKLLPATGARQAMLTSNTLNSATAGDDQPMGALQERECYDLACDSKGILFYAGQAGLYRVLNVGNAGSAPQDWLQKLVVADPTIRRIAIDPDTDDVYLLTLETVQGASVPVIKRVVP
jgi:hypothetical protein